MKANKKIIIGVIAIIALLITIAGALAAPDATYSPVSNAVTLNTTQTQQFSVNVNNPDSLNLSYQWLVDGLPAGPAVLNSELNHSSNYLFDATGKTVGDHIVSIVVNDGATPVLSHAWTVTIENAAPENVLSISNVKINGKSSGKLSASDLNDIKVEVSNEHNEKIKDIVVTVTILDVDGDDLDEESDEFDLSSGKEDDVTLEFDLSDEDLEEEDYTIEIEVDGEDADGNDFSDSETITVEVDREKDDIVILKAELEDSQIFCAANSQTSLNVDIKNIGENEQDGAKITVKNAELELNQQKADIGLDDYSGSENDYKATFALNLEDVKQGSYTLDVAVYSEDNDLMDSKEVELQIVCATGSSQEGKSTEYYADKELAAELQQKIDAYKAMQESGANQNVKQNDSYVLLLGVLVALTFFAVALAATYLLVKRK